MTVGKVAVVGLGLIGGSLLRALAAAGHATLGYDADPATRELARASGYDVPEKSLTDVATAADLVVLAVPLPALPAVLGELSGHPGLITDVTSVKGPVRDLAAAHGIARFVGGHPMAGKETSGFAAADPDLFAGCAWVLALEPGVTALDDWLTLAGLVTRLGARVVPATADEHDRAVAEVSHVPHLFAAALSRRLAGNPLAAALAAGSFRDGTRVAATRAELIAAMCGGNAAAAREVLGDLIEDLSRMREDLAGPDPIAALMPALSEATALRRAWPPGAGTAGEEKPDAGSLLDLGRAGGWVTRVADGHATVSTMRTENGRNPGQA